MKLKQSMYLVLLFIAATLSFSAHTQTISVPYPCTVTAAPHDTVIYRSDTLHNVPVYGCTKERWSWWSWAYVCKQTGIVAYKDSITPLQRVITKTLPHDSAATCYRDSVIPAPITVTRFGAKIQQDEFATQKTVATDLGLYCIRPNSIPMDTYTGIPKSLKDWYDAGFFCIVNICATNTSGDNIVEYLKPADTAAYRVNLERFCKDLKAAGMQKRVIICVENEEINRKYFVGDFGNYLAQLRMSVEIAHASEIKIADGACHLELVDLVRQNNLKDPRAIDTKRLLDAVKNMGVDYVNVHTSYETNLGGFRCKDIPATVEWIRIYTGKAVMSNEYSSKGITAEKEVEFTNAWKKAKVPYAMRWSGDNFNNVMPAGANNEADALNQGATLSEIGKTYKAEIVKP